MNPLSHRISNLSSVQPSETSIYFDSLASKAPENIESLPPDIKRQLGAYIKIIQKRERLQETSLLKETIFADKVAPKKLLVMTIKLLLFLVVAIYCLNVVFPDPLRVETSTIHNEQNSLQCQNATCENHSEYSQEFQVKHMSPLNRKMKVYLELDLRQIDENEQLYSDIEDETLLEQIQKVQIFKVSTSKNGSFELADIVSEMSSDQIVEQIVDGRNVFFGGDVHVIDEPSFIVKVLKRVKETENHDSEDAQQRQKREQQQSQRKQAEREARQREEAQRDRQKELIEENTVQVHQQQSGDNSQVRQEAQLDTQGSETSADLSASEEPNNGQGSQNTNFIGQNRRRLQVQEENTENQAESQGSVNPQASVSPDMQGEPTNQVQPQQSEENQENLSQTHPQIPEASNGPQSEQMLQSQASPVENVQQSELSQTPRSESNPQSESGQQQVPQTQTQPQPQQQSEPQPQSQSLPQSQPEPQPQPQPQPQPEPQPEPEPQPQPRKMKNFPLIITVMSHSISYTIVELLIRFVSLIVVIYVISETPHSPRLLHCIMVTYCNPLIFLEVASPSFFFSFITSVCGSVYLCYLIIFVYYTHERAQSSFWHYLTLSIKEVAVILIFVVNVLRLEHTFEDFQVYTIEVGLVVFVMVILGGYVWDMFIYYEQQLYRDVITVTVTIWYLMVLFASNYAIEEGWQNITKFIIFQVYSINMVYLVNKYEPNPKWQEMLHGPGSQPLKQAGLVNRALNGITKLNKKDDSFEELSMVEGDHLHSSRSTKEEQVLNDQPKRRRRKVARAQAKARMSKESTGVSEDADKLQEEGDNNAQKEHDSEHGATVSERESPKVVRYVDLNTQQLCYY